MSGEVVSLTTRRVRAARPAAHPLVLRWRRQAEDPYASLGFRSGLRQAARDLELAERGELDARYEDEDGLS